MAIYLQKEIAEKLLRKKKNIIEKLIAIYVVEVYPLIKAPLD